MMLDYDWPAGLRDINVRKCEWADGQTDGRTGAGSSPILKAQPRAFGSGELKSGHMQQSANKSGYDRKNSK